MKVRSRVYIYASMLEKKLFITPILPTLPTFASGSTRVKFGFS